MSHLDTKRHTAYMILLGTTLLFAAPSLVIAESEERGEVSQTQESGIEAPVITLMGHIDRVGENELVIDDSLYTFAPNSGLNTNSFSEGQLVNGELDTQRRIIALKILKGTTRQANPPDTGGSGPAADQPMYLEDGVWKN